jgi:voltage-gated potassium channel Kch
VTRGAAALPFALILAIVAPTPARADDGRTNRADRLFREGREAMKRGDLDEACPKFAESQELDPSPGTLLNLALCEQKRGEGARAWAHFQSLVDTLPPGDERAAIARARAEALSRRLARLTVRLAHDAHPETRVWFDNVELSAGDIDVAFVTDPGEHRLLVRAPGRVERRYDVQLVEGKSSSLLVAPAQSPDWVAPPPPPSPLLPAPWRRLELERTAKKKRARKLAAADAGSTSGYGLLALGGAAVGVSSAVTLLALEPDRMSDRNVVLLSSLSTLTGLTIGALGVIMLKNNARGDAHPLPSAGALVPFAARGGGGGVAWRLRF